MRRYAESILTLVAKQGGPEMKTYKKVIMEGALQKRTSPR